MESLNVQRPPRPDATAITEEAEEEEDSFFELELAGPDDSDTNKCSTSTRASDEQERATCTGGTFQQRAAASASPGDKLFSKRRILPIEGLNRPQSPISLLKSTPKFRVFAFVQSKSTAAEGKGHDGGDSLLNLKIEETESRPFFKRSGTSRKAESPDNDMGTSKRFSREAIQKYLRLLKPLYVKVSRKHGGADTSAGEFPVAGPASGSPPKASGTRSKQQLGKSRSASAATTTRADSPARMDDSLVQLQDGIQSAILHCKRSLSASRGMADFSPLSRCDSKTD